jgi:hypothetical protein
VFAGLDDDAARLDLLELCRRSRLPFFDLASYTSDSESGPWHVGRVLFSGQGERYSSCMDLHDQDAQPFEHDRRASVIPPAWTFSIRTLSRSSMIGEQSVIPPAWTFSIRTLSRSSMIGEQREVDVIRP